MVEIKHPDHKAVVKRAWIDRERGTAIRIEMRGVKTRGERPSLAEATKFHRLPNGGWFPVEGCVEGHLIRDGREINIYNSWTVDVNSISIDGKDFPDDLFDIEFPPGANVVTEIAPAPAEAKPRSQNQRLRASRPRGR